MIRCLSCDGILTKDEEICYQCGDPVPGHAKPKGFFSMLLAVVLLVSLGFTAYSFLLGAAQ
jgi:hypothetical protein